MARKWPFYALTCDVVIYNLKSPHVLGLYY